MTGNLRDRLKRIQQKKQDVQTAPPSQTESDGSSGKFTRGGDVSAFTAQGWSPAGYMTLRREITSREGIELPETLPTAAGILMPDIGSAAYEDLLFFDLETTGLSGGAGTVAFLAAFGRLVPAGRTGPKTARYELHITQYLLLDYPGESDFVGAILDEFNRTPAGFTMISYNGKSFDSQILKTRCLMNGITPPDYGHTDLLYPARRLWKRLLPNCSQGTIETGILGIDRTGDIPGAMAPDIWFDFLRNGNTEQLLGICDHNRRDISGLAALFASMIQIADDPLCAAEEIDFDIESLSLRWYGITRRGTDMDLHETGKRLLQFAADSGYPRAVLRFALSLIGDEQYGRGREWLLKAAREDCPLPVRLSALRALAIHSERRLGNTAEALGYSEQGLELLEPDSCLYHDFEHRAERLRKKLISE